MTLSRAASCPWRKKSRRITQTELNHCSSLLQLIVTIILILYSCQVCVQFDCFCMGVLMSLSFSSMYYTIKNSAAFSIPMTIGPQPWILIWKVGPLSVKVNLLKYKKIKWWPHPLLISNFNHVLPPPHAHTPCLIKHRQKYALIMSNHATTFRRGSARYSYSLPSPLSCSWTTFHIHWWKVIRTQDHMYCSPTWR